MKDKIINIAKDLEQGTIDLNTARNLLLGLFDVSGSLPSNELIRERGESFEAVIKWLPEYNEILYHANTLTDEQFREYWNEVQGNVL